MAAQAPRGKAVFCFVFLATLVHLAHSCRKKSALVAHFGFFMVNLRRNLEWTWLQLRSSWPQLGEKFSPKMDPDSEGGAPRASKTPRLRFSLISAPPNPNFLNFRPLETTILIDSGGLPLAGKEEGKPLLQGSWRKSWKDVELRTSRRL